MKKGLVFLAVVSVLLLVMLIACSGGSDSGNEEEYVTITVQSRGVKGEALGSDITIQDSTGTYNGFGVVTKDILRGDTINLKVNTNEVVPNYSSYSLYGVRMDTNKNIIVGSMNEDLLLQMAYQGNLTQLLQSIVGAPDEDGKHTLKVATELTNFIIYDPYGKLPAREGNWQQTSEWQNIQSLLKTLYDATYNGEKHLLNPPSIENIDVRNEQWPQSNNSISANTFTYGIPNNTSEAWCSKSYNTNDQVYKVLVIAPISKRAEINSESIKGITNGGDGSSYFISTGDHADLTQADLEALWGVFQKTNQPNQKTKVFAVGNNVHMEVYVNGNINLQEKRFEELQKKSSTPKIPKRIRKQKRPKTPLKQK